MFCWQHDSSFYHLCAVLSRIHGTFGQAHPVVVLVLVGSFPPDTEISFWLLLPLLEEDSSWQQLPVMELQLVVYAGTEQIVRLFLTPVAALLSGRGWGGLTLRPGFLVI